MNFNDEDELDFEEDFPDYDSQKNEPENEREDKIEDCSMNGCDQYLQIDCLEDEEELLSKLTVEPEKTVKSVKDTEPIKDSLNGKNKNSHKKKQENVPNSNFGRTKRKNGKQRPLGMPHNRLPGSLRSYRWRPNNNNFTRATKQNVDQRLNHLKGPPLRYPKLQNFSPHYLRNQSDFVSLLGLAANNNQNLQQMNLFPNCTNPMLEVRKNFITNGVVGPCHNALFNHFQNNNFSGFQGVVEPNLGVDANSKTFPVSCTNGFKTNYNRAREGLPPGNVLPEGEKKMVKSKKEARLLRFGNDGTGKKGVKTPEQTSEKPAGNNLNLEDEYFRKMEEQKRKREEIFSLKEKQGQCNGSAQKMSLSINKEFLMKKENPFEGSFKMAGGIKFEIKEEKQDGNGKENQNGSSGLEDLCFVKKEVETPVKFVRTVSKSFEELGLSKGKSGLFSKMNFEFDDCPKTSLVDTASQTQTEPHLTGCIVKVLNVPPSTTANDILALCTPFGIVREVKLNFPNENSVAIRFGEPKSAENFFKLYDGRTIDDHTLSVITV